jgi:hypothetical protein
MGKVMGVPFVSEVGGPGKYDTRGYFEVLLWQRGALWVLEG